MEGFGEKSFEKLKRAIEEARDTTSARFLYSLGVPNIGPANAKLICKAFQQDFNRVRHAKQEELTAIEGVGPVIAKEFAAFFAEEENNIMIDDLLTIVRFSEEEQQDGTESMEGIRFVITGSVNHFANRSELKEKIESHGGKVTGSVTAKTTYLINNDSGSHSSKNQKAKELGIPIITEEEFMEKFQIR